MTGYRKDAEGGVTCTSKMPTDHKRRCVGRCSSAWYGIHSAVRAQMHPDQPPIHWGGALSVARHDLGEADPQRLIYSSGSAHRHRVVFYPISHPDPKTGLAMVNWIAEVTTDNAEGWKQRGWFREVNVGDFIHHFDNWVWDWLDVPALIRQADAAFENPMIDPDPRLDMVRRPGAAAGRCGSRDVSDRLEAGRSQAIVDARLLGAALIEHGVTPGTFRRTWSNTPTRC